MSTAVTGKIQNSELRRFSYDFFSTAMRAAVTKTLGVLSEHTVYVGWI